MSFNSYLQELGLSCQEYELLYDAQNEFDQYNSFKPKEQEILKCKNNEDQYIADLIQQYEREKQDLNASELLILQLMEQEGRDPDEIAKTFESFNKERQNHIQINQQVEQYFGCREPLTERTNFAFQQGNCQKEDIQNKMYKNLMEEEVIEGNCQVCLEELCSKAFYQLFNCSHSFHIECLEEYIIDAIQSRKFPIKCLLPDCKAEIDAEDIKNSIQTQLKYQIIFNELSFKSYVESNPKDFYHCPTADCKYICVINGPRYDCPLCNKSYCTQCQTDWHQNLNCEQFKQLKRDQGDNVFIKYAESNGYKKCPKCRLWVSRTEGCNAMVCRCQASFCYQCGKEGDGHNCNH